MARDPHSTSDDESFAPPSFVPSASHKRTSPAADTSSLPPSFTPSGASGASKPTMTPRHDQTPVGSKQPPLPREPRRAGGSSRTLHAPQMGSQNSEQPHSAAPSYSPSYASSQRSAPSYRTPNATHANNGTSGGRHFSDFGRGGNGTNGGRNGRNAAAGRGNGTVAKKRNPRRVVITILASLLAIILVLLLALYLWVNSQLQHYNGLSTKEDDSSQTWLITGSDVRDGTEGTGAKGSVVGERTDSIMLLVKPKSGATALISIPRDTYVTVGGTDMKLNAVSETYGWEKLTETIEDISGLKVDHLVRIGFGGVTKVVDAVGGIQLCYNRSFTDSYAQLTWDSGCHNVSGSTALKFSRARYSDPNGDFGRTERQRLVIQAIAKKAATPSTLLNLPKAQKVTSAALAAIKVDEKANPFSLLQMALAFKSATGADGITGTVYYSNPDYYPPSGIGSTIELDSTKTTDMFTAIAAGTQKKGTVGGYVAG